MEHFSEFILTLRRGGLYVSTDGSTEGLIGIRRAPLAADKSGSEAVRFERTVLVQPWSLDGETVFLEDYVNLKLLGSAWLLMNHVPMLVGGYNLDKIQCVCSSLTEVRLVVENYYFQPPVAINNWIFPVFQQPSWNLERINAAVHRAQPISFFECASMRRARLAQIKKDRDAVAPNEVDPEFDPYVFYSVHRRDPSSPLLYLRYDCAEAFICREPSGREREELIEELGAEICTEVPHGGGVEMDGG